MNKQFGGERLAKICPPRLVEAVARERAFGELDRKLAHAVAWLSAAPGSGKTTLAAAYAKARQRPLIWYQVDRGDEDVASFFHYLEHALEGRRAGRSRPLPRFVPELRSDLAGFARRFAREAWARLPASALIVFDNVHEAPAPAFGQVLAALLEELPEGVSAIAISRAAPGPQFVDLLGRRRIVVLDPNALRFNLGEAVRLLASHRLPRTQIARMQKETQGWAAGLILMSESGKAAPGGAPGQTRERLFAYFATQVVDRLPVGWQTFLMATAALPKVTAAMGNSLTRTKDGAAILDGLHRHNLFVDRRAEPDAIYQYHPLFREFLAERARTRWSAVRRTAVARRAAHLAQANGWFEDAIALFHEAGDSEGAAQLLESWAPVLLAQGRAETVEHWIGTLPESILDARPSLWLQLGHARIQRDEIAARESFQRAYAASTRRGDDRAATLAACAALETIFTSFRDWSGVDLWTAGVREHFPRVSQWPRSLDRLRAYSGLLLALMMSADRDDSEAERVVKVLVRLLGDESIDVNDRLRAAALIVDTCAQLPNRRAIFASVDPIARSLAEHPGSSPLLQARYFLNSADEASFESDAQAAQARIDRARALIERHGWRHKAFVLACRSARVAFYRRDLSACDARLAEVDRHTEPGNVPQQTLRSVLHYHRDLLKGDVASALEHARTALRSGETQLPSGYVSLLLQMLAFAQMASGHFEAAGATLERSMGMATGFAARRQCVTRELAFAAARLDQVPNPSLEAGLALARSIGDRDFLLDLPDLFRKVCLEALRRGIETRFVTEVIASRRMAPPDPNEPAWPWPVRVRMLGDFSLHRGTEPVASRGKTSRRLLDLLKVIIASGRRQVPAAYAIATLWPELEGDQAKAAFNVALHRLRKLIGVPEAVVLDGGTLALSPEHVWVDAFAFEHYATQAEVLFSKRHIVEAERSARVAMELYGGHFLHSGDDAPWQFVQRERLSAMYTRVATVAGQYYLDAGRAKDAQRVFEHASDLEPLAEEVHRKLMLALVAQGEPAEALRVYRRCREMLSIVLGVRPSPETERIRKAVQGETRDR